MGLDRRRLELQVQKQRQIAILTFTVVTATLALTFYTVNAFRDSRAQREREYINRAQIEEIMEEVQRSQEESKNARIQLDETLQRLSHLRGTGNTTTGTEQRLAAITQDLSNVKQQVDTLQRGVDGISAAISSSPEKAVALPLLTKDVDDLKVSSEHDIEAVRSEMIRSYDQTKWLIGFILAALIGTVINSAIQSRGSRQQPHHVPRFE
ncbi:MAG TPA: hypothetical protein VK722_15625 [Candidatus Aquilonibacter sp.]|jgi:hypothetical protein|nr:hypothetical protein [Candidatus Aquilonibacter sp.]